jgi:hypothetical protein
MSKYEFGNARSAATGGGPLTMYWYDGALLPWSIKGFPPGIKMSGDGGVVFMGSKGMLMHETYGERPVLIGEGLDEAAAKIAPSLPRVAGGMGAHEMNWIRAIRGEEKISCPFEYACRLNETMNLGVVAMRADASIDWDAAAGRVTNVADANAYLSRAYRPGWEL